MIRLTHVSKDGTIVGPSKLFESSAFLHTGRSSNTSNDYVFSHNFNSIPDLIEVFQRDVGDGDDKWVKLADFQQAGTTVTFNYYWNVRNASNTLNSAELRIWIVSSSNKELMVRMFKF
jgi:hypothetical protein